VTEEPAAAGPRAAHLDENIGSLLEVQKREWEQRGPAQRFVDRISRLIGRPTYLIVLLGFTTGWIGVNILGPRLGLPAFDPLPFALLDGTLSLAALVSTTMVLIAQNRQARLEQQHTHIALQVNLLTEQKVAKVINLIEELRRDLPMVKNRYDPQAEVLARKTDALEVLSAIEEVGLIDDPAEARSSATGPPQT
jgi:uncharacterized membrane protein